MLDFFDMLRKVRIIYAGGRAVFHYDNAHRFGLIIENILDVCCLSDKLIAMLFQQSFKFTRIIEASTTIIFSY